MVELAGGGKQTGPVPIPTTDEGAPEEGWPRVAWFIDVWIDALYDSKSAFIRESNISIKTLNGYLVGEPIVRDDKRKALCRALNWTPDSIDQIRQGGTPEIDPFESSPLPRRNPSVLGRIEEELRAIREELVVMDSRLSEIEGKGDQSE